MYTVQYFSEKNVKTLAFIKRLHHANRFSFLKPLKHDMKLAEKVTLIHLEYYLCLKKCSPS